ncbi:MAG: copper-binding protein [Acidobacteria bacterium]|nr:copper-binding protein [Acidobacteriota bacterium]
MKRLTPALAAAMILVAAVAFAQPPAQPPAQTPAPRGEAVLASASAVIQAIDSASRAITLKFDDGSLNTVVAGPEIQRFNDLKVGDKVTFKYYESVVYAIQQPGAKPPVAEATGIVRSQSGSPAGVAARTLTAVVTIQVINPTIPSITVKREDGSSMSFKVEDPKNLAGVKVGDKVQVTYTQALAVSVESPKAEAPKK